MTTKSISSVLTVLKIFNNNMHKIDNVGFNSSPLSTFKHKDNKIQYTHPCNPIIHDLNKIVSVMLQPIPFGCGREQRKLQQQIVPMTVSIYNLLIEFTYYNFN